MLPIFGKIFQKVVFNRIYNFFSNGRLLNPKQFGLRTSGSCINQLFAITHEIFESFDCNPSLEVRSNFLDICKAFNKVLQKCSIYKLKCMGISGKLYKLSENCLLRRFQRVILNGKISSWRPILASVPENSVLEPLLFLVYNNDLPNGLKTNAELFADDSSLFTTVKDKNEAANAFSNDLSLISK